MERLRDDLEGKYRRDLTELSLEHKQELGKLQAACEKQMREMEMRLQLEAEAHAQRVEELQARHLEVVRESKERAEEAVR
jgi:hypothetical protein